MKFRFALIALLALGLVTADSCSKRYRIEIQSDVCWDGLIDTDGVISDCGNASYKVTGKLTCVKVQKKTVAGYLRVRVDGGVWAETTEPLGLVQVCR